MADITPYPTVAQLGVLPAAWGAKRAGSVPICSRDIPRAWHRARVQDKSVELMRERVDQIQTTMFCQMTEQVDPVLEHPGGKDGIRGWEARVGQLCRSQRRAS